MRPVVADTSCFILFTKIDELRIIKDTFASGLISTDRVEEEYGSLPKWVDVRTTYDVQAYKKLRRNFGPGEASCIALAQQLENPLILIDDRRAKTVAEAIGLECTGTLGALLIAKRQRVIHKVEPYLTN